MVSHHRPPALRRFASVFATAFGLLLATVTGFSAAAPDAAPGVRTFDIPAGPGDQALRRFTAQSGIEVVFGTATVAQVRANAVKGDLPPREAIARLLEGTGLIVVANERTGALTVSRDPNARRAAPASAGDRPGTTATTRPADETLVLSPFEVRSADRGYFAANTMAGTRLNSKIEDLASSITVVTKEQMSDFAMLDVNDVFLYEAGTEGTGTYTEFAFDRNGAPMDNTQLDPNNANRIRGVGPANTAFGNFETSGRVPIDPINIDAVEISRGPNANIFGLGNAAGTVNVQPASANLGRHRSQLSVRADSFDGHRSSVDLNRVLKPGVLAVRGSAVYQHDGFDRKPSGTDTTRLNGMVKYQPFKTTTLTGSYSRYRMTGNRPNTTMPRDAVSAWRAAGSATWNPLTSRVTLNGVPSATTFGIATLPPYLQNINGTGRTNSTFFVDGNGAVLHWGPTQATTTTNPADRNQAVFLVNTFPENVRAGQPLFAGPPSVESKDIYDWSRLNFAAINRLHEKTATTNLRLEHIFLNTPRHLLAFEAAYFREDSARYRRDLIGTANTAGHSGTLYVDVNERMSDGSPNPNLLRPFIGLWRSSSYDNPLQRETYRTQLAYKLDLREEKGVLRWAGMHQVSLYGEYKDVVQRRTSYRDALLSDHAWLAPSVARADPSTVVTINYFSYYVGDATGSNVDYAPAPFAGGAYDYRWGNALTGNIRNERARIGAAVATDGTAAGRNTRQVLKTHGAVVQSFFLRDRLVTTFGLRKDRNYNTRGIQPVLQPDGITLDPRSYYAWAPEGWAYNEGPTATAGAVVKPLRWLHLHANVSDSFQPNAAAVDLQLRPLPDPTGEGRDYGFTLLLFDGRLVARVNQYKTKQINSRNGESTTLAGRVRATDFDTPLRASTPFMLVPKATEWVTNAARARGQTLTPAQIEAEVSRITRLDPKFLVELTDPLGETEDVVAKGTEVELHYNPSDFWTLKLNVTRQESINSRISPGLSNWIAERMPVWQSLIDPELGRPWFTERYGNLASAAENLATNVTAPLGIALTSEGKSRPQVRKYRANLSTSYRLAGLTDQRLLKRFTVGGALRWEDKGAIGYYGVQQLPAVITELDRNRPIWDKARLYVDAFASYRMRLFADKVATTLQLNVRNAQENGRLQPISAYPNGRYSGYRIVDPRQFILTATFDL